jgi:hypothetical protein
MTDDIHQLSRWTEDESGIRAKHEKERLAQGGRIGSNGLINPYTYAQAEVLLVGLDKARAETAELRAQLAEARNLVGERGLALGQNEQIIDGLRAEVERRDAEIARLKAPPGASERRMK